MKFNGKNYCSGCGEEVKQFYANIEIGGVCERCYELARREFLAEMKAERESEYESYSDDV